MKLPNCEPPLRTAITGIGGFGTAHHGVFESFEAEKKAKVIATCDPALGQLEPICQRFHFDERKIQTHTDFDEMLAAHSDKLDLGVVATPIHLHARMHEAFVNNRIACYLEKPPTLDPEEFARMLNVETEADLPTNVGFSFVHTPGRLALKQRILKGEFGTMKSLSFLGLSQRNPAYFQRNNWTGKLTLNGRLLLDSCLGNAMSHFVNSMLFFAGLDGEYQWARPHEMRCELYRANQIEGPDTIFATSRLQNGLELRIAASHACPNQEQITEEVLEFDDATITIRSIEHVTIQRRGESDELFSITGASLLACVDDYLNFLRKMKERPAQTLQDCRGFVETNALFYLAGKRIHHLPGKSLMQESGAAVVLQGVEQAARHLIANNELPSEASCCWAQAGGQADIDSIQNLASVVREMRLALE